MAGRDEVRASLMALQSGIRTKPAGGVENYAMSRRIVDAFATEDAKMLILDHAEVAVLERVEAALMDDPRFEYMDRVPDTVWEFACQAWADRGRDHVASFCTEHAREPELRNCYLPVHSLQVQDEVAIFGLRLLPVDADEVPKRTFGWQRDQSVLSVVAVPAKGTSLRRMHDRAFGDAELALRALRLALSAQRFVREEQLRFRLGMTFAFDEDLAGWKSPPEQAISLTLTPDVAAIVAASPIAQIRPALSTGEWPHVRLAQEWIERATFTAEDTVRLLFLFFALEALIGDRAQREKGHSLVFRQALLSHIASEHFRHPSSTLVLYDEVRSTAVHGGRVEGLTKKDVDLFAASLRDTLDDVISVSRAQNFSGRTKLIRFLDNHPEQATMLTWLRAHGGTYWESWTPNPDTATL